MGFIPFTLIDFIDIFLVAGLMFAIYRATRGTSAPYIFFGIIIVCIAWVMVRALNMELLSNILGQVISVGVIALIIIFQPEIRRFLQLIGMRQKEFDFISRMFSASRKKEDINTSPIVSACLDMSNTKTGALIVIRQKDDLLFIIENGIAVDANLSVSLLKNIFFKNAPLHDGAAVIEGNRIVAAKCILPVTQSDVPKEYGTRHRSAIGLSELTDAVVVVVSEETGALSVVKSGQIKHNIDPQKFGSVLKKALGQK
ncbi:MAG: diadenylate cyclase CdaA [Alistipes sp.]|nr:diadenylate cyclase CdaA [Alistipes sp.]MBQ6869652.1 diadenylate cyclase CdaA [Alistipes sp.]MBQ7951502.1 diadenylate cyclase CdaA [Alistipes sp.]